MIKRLAVIGTNKITKYFLEAALRVPEIAFTAVYSRKMETAKAFAMEYGVKKCYDSLKALADDTEIDCVYIASPNSCHCKQAITMLKSGKHVLCEKPIASNIKECHMMIEAAKQGKAILLEAMRPVYDDGFKQLIKAIHKIEPIRQAVFQFSQYSSRYDNYKNGAIENAFRPELSNAALMDIGVYCVHPMVRLFGMPEEIKADAVILPNGFEGAGTICAHYEGFFVQLIYSKINNQNIPCQIQGENGTLLFETMSDIRNITIYDRAGEKEIIFVEKDDNNMIYEIKEWLYLMEHPEKSEQYATYSKWEMAVMDEAREQTGIVFPADDKD